MLCDLALCVLCALGGKFSFFGLRLGSGASTAHGRDCGRSQIRWSIDARFNHSGAPPRIDIAPWPGGYVAYRSIAISANGGGES
jgi:hypothetical protein